MNTQLIKDVKSGLTISVIFIISVLIFGITYAAISHVNSLDPLTAAKWNEIVDTVNGGISIPSGGIIAFNLSSCPTGWKAADGENETPDLRGQFIRGINNFGSPAGTRSDGKQDPDGPRSIGSHQADELKSHNHTYHEQTMSTSQSYIGAATTSNKTSKLGNSSSYGGNETRPKNIGLIYCVKN